MAKILIPSNSFDFYCIIRKRLYWNSHLSSFTIRMYLSTFAWYVFVVAWRLVFRGPRERLTAMIKWAARWHGAVAPPRGNLPERPDSETLLLPPWRREFVYFSIIDFSDKIYIFWNNAGHLYVYTEWTIYIIIWRCFSCSEPATPIDLFAVKFFRSCVSFFYYLFIFTSVMHSYFDISFFRCVNCWVFKKGSYF